MKLEILTSNKKGTDLKMKTVYSTQSAVVRNLNDVKRTLQYDVEKIENMIKRIDDWSATQSPEVEYNGEYGFIVLDLMTGLLNTSNKISAIESAIRNSMVGGTY